MITQTTASVIWSAYREIEAAEKLLSDMSDERAKPFRVDDKFAPTLKDAFGRNQHLQLGIPSGDNGHRLFQVRPELAESVIRAHIGQMKAKLIEANECARVELNAAEIEVRKQ